MNPLKLSPIGLFEKHFAKELILKMLFALSACANLVAFFDEHEAIGTTARVDR